MTEYRAEHLGEGRAIVYRRPPGGPWQRWDRRRRRWVADWESVRAGSGLGSAPSVRVTEEEALRMVAGG